MGRRAMLVLMTALVASVVSIGVLGRGAGISSSNFVAVPTAPGTPLPGPSPGPHEPTDVPWAESSLATTVPTAPPTAAPAIPGTVSMAFTGDSLWHSPLWAQAQRNYAEANGTAGGYDFGPMMAGIAPVLSAVDLAVCHEEVPIAPEGEDFTTSPLYGVPPEVATALAGAGFDRCSLASNHSADRGVAGIDRTVNVFEAAGLGHAGMARTPEEIAPRVFTVNGIAISHLSYTYSYNGLVLPAGQEWRSALIDPNRIIADAHQARALGAQVVVVSLQWGVEGRAPVSAEQRRLAEQLTASGVIDLIVGHHAHVLQPIEQINGVWVIYGLGNIVSNMPTGTFPPASQDGAIATLTMTLRPDGRVDVSRPAIIPTWCDRDQGWIVRLVQPTLADPATAEPLRRALTASLERTRSVLADYIPV